jgi:hypothetical protein
VDHIKATASGPGFGLRALVAHVDGRFRARAWVFGCLGGGGNNYPLVARVSRRVVLQGDYDDYTADSPTLVLGGGFRRSDVVHGVC